MQYISVITIPAMFFLIIIYGIFKNIPVYDSFVEGAKDSLPILINILPPLIGLMTAIGMLRASGALELIINALKPLCTFLKIPPEVLPLALMRPISGSGSIAVANDIFAAYGPDSQIGRTASVIMGSTETTFYVITVYFSAVSAKNIRHTLTAALIADLVSIAAACVVCRFI